MKKHILIGCFLTLFLNCKEVNKQYHLEDSYVKALNENRKIRAKNRVKYLELTGLFKLDSTTNSFGKAASNKFILDIKNLATSIGSIDLSKEGLRFNAVKKYQSYECSA